MQRDDDHDDKSTEVPAQYLMKIYKEKPYLSQIKSTVLAIKDVKFTV